MNNVDADHSMKVLSSYLFRPTPPEAGGERVLAPLSGDEALSVLGFLVSSDPSKYLKPASRAVRDEALALAKDARPMRVSSELMATLVSQLSSPDVQVSTNAAEAIVACCRKLGPAEFGEPVLRSIAEAWRGAWNAVGDPTKRSVASTVAVRCASAIVDVVCIDDAMMRAASAAGDISLILTMLTDESDPLLETSTLDLIERLATAHPMHHERARWLVSNDIVIPLLQMCGTWIIEKCNCVIRVHAMSCIRR